MVSLSEQHLRSYSSILICNDMLHLSVRSKKQNPIFLIGKYGSTSYMGMEAANRKGIGPTTLKRACNSTTNTRTKYLLVVMHKTLCNVWLTFVRRENEMVQNCPIVLKNSSSSSYYSYFSVTHKLHKLHS